MQDSLRAPFPWFGGKTLAAPLIWKAFGNVPNYVEPFAGSLAVLLARPHAPGVETVNDKDAFIANFWRAVAVDPEAVAYWADWPINEVDLTARHQWLVNQTEFTERMLVDCDYYDAKIAGWWLWGICQWIGHGWCVPLKSRSRAKRRPSLTRSGIHAGNKRSPLPTHQSVVEKRPSLGRSGRGVHKQWPDLAGDGSAVGKGTHASGQSIDTLYDWMHALSDRLRRVRVCCGDWKRVLGPSPTTCIGVTGILLDPPYSAETHRHSTIYREESLVVAHDAREWAIAHGDDPKLRIVLCGFEHEHEMPRDWRCIVWKAHGGYGGGKNRHRERLWLSPYCLDVADNQLEMFP